MTIHFTNGKTTPPKVQTSFDIFEQKLLMYALCDDYMSRIVKKASIRPPKTTGE